MKVDRRTRRLTRRGLFKVWVGITIVFAAALALVLPFIQGEWFAFLAGVPVMVLNLVLLVLALGWLIWHVFLTEPRRPPDAPGEPSAGARNAEDVGR